MAADNFTATLNLQYTPPGAPVNSGIGALSSAGTYNAGQSGTIDIPTTVTIGDAFAVPFGSVQSAKLLVLKNNLSSEISVKLNGSSTVNFNIPPGGEFAYIVPTSPGASPMSQVSILVTAVPTVVERIQFWVLGD